MNPRVLPDGEIRATKDLNAHRTTPYVANVTVTDGYNTVTSQLLTIRITSKFEIVFVWGG